MTHPPVPWIESSPRTGGAAPPQNRGAPGVEPRAGITAEGIGVVVPWRARLIGDPPEARLVRRGGASVGGARDPACGLVVVRSQRSGGSREAAAGMV
jgi:hypothetical protein